MLETGKRDGFHVRTQEYFARMLDGLGSTAACISAITRDRRFPGLSASSMGAGPVMCMEPLQPCTGVMPNYLMQWEMIRWALQSGCEIYDFQGVPCWYDRDNPNYGVYRFQDRV